MENVTQIKEIKGFLSANLVNNQTLDDFCVEHIPNYNKERLQAVAIRLFVAKETVITIYALDRMRQENESETLPVKKFKISDISVASLFSYFSSFNCTLSTGEYDIEEMEVINK